MTDPSDDLVLSDVHVHKAYEETDDVIGGYQGRVFILYSNYFNSGIILTV